MKVRLELAMSLVTLDRFRYGVYRDPRRRLSSGGDCWKVVAGRNLRDSQEPIHDDPREMGRVSSGISLDLPIHIMYDRNQDDCRG
jgi:hypothetical protein